MVHTLLKTRPRFIELKIREKCKGRLNLQDTNLRSSFCDPYWELICHNKQQPGIQEISIPPQKVVGSHLLAQHGTKTSPAILPADADVSW